MRKQRRVALLAVLFFAVPILFLRAEELFFDSDGVKIHYIIQGQGEPVLLIHGFSANIGMQWVMPGVVAGLSKDYQVIALDNRGHGTSDKPHDPNQYGSKMVEDSIRLLDHLKIKKAHVVGYSMGGFITMKMLTLHPDRMLTGVLGGAGWGKENDPQFESIRALADSLEQGKGFGPLLEALTPEGQPKPTEEKIKNMNAMMNTMNDVPALAACVRNFNGLMVTEEQVRAIKVPTLALIGGIDPLKRTVDPLVGVLPNVKVTVIDGADHMTAFGNPIFIKSLREFLAEHRQASELGKKAPVAAGN